MNITFLKKIKFPLGKMRNLTPNFDGFVFRELRSQGTNFELKILISDSIMGEILIQIGFSIFHSQKLVGNFVPYF